MGRPKRRIFRSRLPARCILCAALVLGVGNVASAESREDFAKRIAAAYGMKNRVQALHSLFDFDDVDAEIRARYRKRIIPLMMGKHDKPAITFEPLPEDFDPVQVSNGVEYRPNLTPLGYLVLDKRTRVPYGRKQERYFLTAMTRRVVNPNAPPDRMFQMILIGLASPRVTFKGHCDVMQSNGASKRMKFEDNGHGNRTLIVMAQSLKRCHVTNTSKRGSLSLRLLDGEKVIFHRRVESPATTIIYPR